MSESSFYISEIVFGDDGYVVVTNGSSSPADPDGLELCQFPEYPDVPAGMVEAGGSVQVPGADLGGLFNDAGEVALYTIPEYENPDAVAGYVQWGNADHKRAEPAVAGGVWPDNAFVEAKGSAKMTAAGPEAKSPDAWTVS